MLSLSIMSSFRFKSQDLVATEHAKRKQSLYDTTYIVGCIKIVIAYYQVLSLIA